MMLLTQKCKFCGRTYYPIQNVGAWECDKQRAYSFVEGTFIKMRADHVPQKSSIEPDADNRPYTEADDFPIPEFAFRYFQKYTLPEAILQRRVSDTTTSTGSYRVFQVIVVRRFDFRAKQRADKFWPDVPPTGEKFLLSKDTPCTWR